MRAWRTLTAAILPLAARHLIRRKLVAGFAIVGLASGLATLLATQLLYDSVVTSYAATTTRLAGRAALVVTNGDSGVAEELVDDARGVRGVRAVVASVEGFVPAADLPGERLYLYGIDLLAADDARDVGGGSQAIVSDPMIFLAAPDSVAVTEAFARAHRLGLLDRIRVETPSGVVALTIRALLAKPDGPAAVLDGRIAVVDLSVAQGLLRLEGRVSSLAVAVEPGTDVEEAARRLAARIGARGVVERPTSRTAAFGRLLNNYRNGLFVAASVAIVVALYFLVVIVDVAVAERRRELALLRSLGMRSHALVALIGMELLVLAAIATGVGVPGGIGLARRLLATFGAGVATLYADVGRPELHVAGHTVLAAAVVGLGVPVLAVLGAIRRTRSIQPIEALRTGGLGWRHPDGSRRALQASCVVAGGAGALWAARARTPLSLDTAGMIVLLGAVASVALAVPWLVERSAAVGERLAVAAGRALPLLAARNVKADLRRIAVTCSAVLVSVAGSIAVASWVRSLDETLHAAFDTVFARVDLVVSGGADPFAPEAVRFPAEVAARIARLPGVAATAAVRLDAIAFEESRAAVVAADAPAGGDGGHRLVMVEGGAAMASARLAAGTGVVVNQAFARRFGRRSGDVLALTTPEGRLSVPIVGIHLELTPGDLGTIRMSRALYRRWWRDDSASLVEVSLRRGADASSVAAAIRAALAERHRVVVLTIGELRQTFRRLLGRMTALVYPLLVVAVLCALVGVAASGAVAVIARRRPIATMRAIGFTRPQVARLLGCELAIVGAIAGTMAVAVGTALGWVQVEVLLRGMLGMAVLRAHPWALAFGGGLAVVVLTGAWGWIIGRRAAAVALSPALHGE